MHPRIKPRNGMHFPVDASVESSSQNSGSERDTLSGWHAWRKLRPSIWLQNGTTFPNRSSSGNYAPDLAFRPGCRFRLRPRAESASHNPQWHRSAFRVRVGVCAGRRMTLYLAILWVAIMFDFSTTLGLWQSMGRQSRRRLPRPRYRKSIC